MFFTCFLSHRIAIVPSFCAEGMVAASLGCRDQRDTETQKVHRPRYWLPDTPCSRWIIKSLIRNLTMSHLEISHRPMPICAHLQGSEGDGSSMVWCFDMFCWVQSVHVFSHGTLPPATGCWPRCHTDWVQWGTRRFQQAAGFKIPSFNSSPQMSWAWKGKNPQPRNYAGYPLLARDTKASKLERAWNTICFDEGKSCMSIQKKNLILCIHIYIYIYSQLSNIT